MYIGKYLGVERQCTICGKPFIVPDSEWVFKRVYKNATWFFCSWTCMRKFEAEHEIKKGNMECEKAGEIRKMLRAGEYPKYIADTLGVKISTILYYRERLGPEE